MRKTEEQWWNTIYKNYLKLFNEEKTHYQSEEMPKTIEEFKATYPHNNPYARN